jgi:HAD superfamily hydrolase (TIGR01509 family)
MMRLICFDLDGVLVDAVEWHYESLNRALQEVCGFTLSREEHLVTYNALPTKRKLEVLIGEGRIQSNQVDNIFRLKQVYTKECIINLAKPDPVKIAMHEKLRDMGFVIACVTNSITETAGLMLTMTGQRPYIDLLVANDVIGNAKPHPEGYIRAMVHFHAMPEETLIVEDSPKGLQAAYATGAIVCEVEGPYDVTFETISKYLEVK